MNNTEHFFQTLCEQYYADLGNYLLAMTRDRELAQDLLQETFIVAWKKRELLPNHPNPGGFLFQTARLCLKNARQRQKKQQSRLIYLEQEQLAQQSDQRRATDLWEELCRQQDASVDEAQWIAPALQTLSEQEYQLYRQHYLEKKSFAQLAREQNISPVSLRMRALRIRRKIYVAVRQLSAKQFSLDDRPSVSKGGDNHEKI